MTFRSGTEPATEPPCVVYDIKEQDPFFFIGMWVMSKASGVGIIQAEECIAC